MVSSSRNSGTPSARRDDLEPRGRAAAAFRRLSRETMTRPSSERELGEVDHEDVPFGRPRHGGGRNSGRAVIDEERRTVGETPPPGGAENRPWSGSAQVRVPSTRTRIGPGAGFRAARGRIERAHRILLGGFGRMRDRPVRRSSLGHCRASRRSGASTVPRRSEPLGAERGRACRGAHAGIVVARAVRPPARALRGEGRRRLSDARTGSTGRASVRTDANVVRAPE